MTKARQKRWSRKFVIVFAMVCSQLALHLTLLLSEDYGLPLTLDHLPPMDHHSSRNKIRIYYNLFISEPEHTSRVVDIYHEQSQAINPDLHDESIYISTIGYDLRNMSSGLNIINHYQEGGEDVTLHSLWEYCQANTQSKVVYLHSKGSFHPDESNNRLRRFLTEGALSRECADLPDDCDVCSSRMSTHPHPHTSGNMWLAKCNYIAKLLDPFVLREGHLPSDFNNDNGCKGFGRYFFEHWVYSHPSVRPCDLYPGDEYTWAYENIPDVNFTKDMQKAPRFGFDKFVSLLRRSYWYCREDKSSQTILDYLENRKWSYNQLYNTTALDKSWYLWQFLNLSGDSIMAL